MNDAAQTGRRRHSVSGIYYAMKRNAGKRKEHSLVTTDHKVAERGFRVSFWPQPLKGTRSQPSLASAQKQKTSESQTDERQCRRLRDFRNHYAADKEIRG